MEQMPSEKSLRAADSLVHDDLVRKELDLRGSVCPGPTGDTLQALKELSPGDRLTVILDYLPARQTLPRLLEERGHRWRITDDDGTTFYMDIEKGDNR